MILHFIYFFLVVAPRKCCKLFIVVERKQADFKMFILHYNLTVLLNSEVTG